jgi:Arc/MetJ family transcription regulator
MMLFLMQKEKAMRTTITLDDELVERAQRMTGINDKSTLLKTALTRMVQQEAAKRLIQLGGSDPDAKAAPRRRWKLDGSGLENT